MFKESEKHPQLDAFSSPGSLLRGKSLNFYQDKTAWHNLFRNEVKMRVDESLFSVLFCPDNGAPNASISVLVSMMILKEAQGWSDSQLFEECRYNMLIRGALGLFNLDDSIPTDSTYYLFRKRIVEHEKATGENLMEKAFAAITKSQAVDFQVSGKQIRMDSKLIGSNIALYSRYELVHETLRVFYNEREAYILKRDLGKATMALLDSLAKENGDKVVYRSTKAEVATRMKELGQLMHKLLNIFKPYPGDDYTTLERVFNEQFYINESKAVLPLDKEKISPKSIQSPHDTDCTYRNKDGNKVRGYSVNVTETCDQQDGQLNLVTDVQVDVVSVPDTKFLEPAVNATREIITGKVEKIYTDGAYNSPDNQDYCKDGKCELITASMQGAIPRYELSIDQQTDEIIVKDTKTGEIKPARKVISKKKPDTRKWAIKTDENKLRYFTPQELEASLLREKIRQTPRDELNIRNNVEATIFQLGYHYSNDKSRYRTLCKHKMWANARALWINFVRILKFNEQICQRTIFSSILLLKNELRRKILTIIYIYKHFFNFNCSQMIFAHFSKMTFSEGTQFLSFNTTSYSKNMLYFYTQLYQHKYESGINTTTQY